MGETGAHAGDADAAVGRDDAGEGQGPVADGPVAGQASDRPALADVMADMPGVWRRLLAAHVPDRLGRCRGCRSDTGSGERWPCSLHRIATEARRLHDQKLTQAIDSD